MTKIREDNFSCDVEIREFGKDEKDVLLRFCQMDFRINNSYLILDTLFKDVSKLKLYEKYSVKIYRYSEEPEYDTYYYVDGYLVLKARKTTRFFYDKMQKFIGCDFELMTSYPKDYIKEQVEEMKKKKDDLVNNKVK